MKSIKVLNKIRSLPSEPLKAACTYSNTCTYDYSECVNSNDYCFYDYASCSGGAIDACSSYDFSACSGNGKQDLCDYDYAGCCLLVDGTDSCDIDTCGWNDFF